MTAPHDGGMSRRTFLRSAAGVVVVGGAVAAGVFGPRAFEGLAGDDCGPQGVAPPRGGIPVSYETIASDHVEGPVEIAVATPPGLPAAAPVCIALPGRGGRGRDVMSSLRMHDFLAQAVERRGVTPFALVGVDGGESYWHRRADGEDRMALLEREVIPRLRRDGLGRGAPVLLAGWSMGGYGALLAASRRPGDYRAVAVASPAVWRTAGETAQGAFDSPEDFARNDVLRAAARLSGPSVRVDCGAADPFIDGARALVAALPERPEGDITEAGCHDVGYWWRIAPAQIDFLARAAA